MLLSFWDQSISTLYDIWSTERYWTTVFYHILKLLALFCYHKCSDLPQQSYTYCTLQLSITLCSQCVNGFLELLDFPCLLFQQCCHLLSFIAAGVIARDQRPQWITLFFKICFQLRYCILKCDKTQSLTLKHREMHGCVVSTVDTDALVLKHQAISILSTE